MKARAWNRFVGFGIQHYSFLCSSKKIVNHPLVEHALPPLSGHFLTQEEVAWITQLHWDRHRDEREWSILSTLTHDCFAWQSSGRWPGRNVCKKKSFTGVVLMSNKDNYRLWPKGNSNEFCPSKSADILALIRGHLTLILLFPGAEMHLLLIHKCKNLFSDGVDFREATFFFL